MTIDEANDAVEAANETREDAIDNVLTACPAHLIEALEQLGTAQEAYMAAIEVWWELDHATQK